MNLFKQFKTSKNLEIDGIVLEYGSTEDGRVIEFRIARAGGGNKAYDKAVETQTKSIRKQLQNDLVENDQLLRIMRNVYAETVVLGWKNVEDEAGKPIPFTRENCITLFEDLPDLFLDIQEQSRKMTLFRQANLDIAAGN